jgi:hypothetical protein
MSDYTRPGLLRWLWYAFGGRLPRKYNTWVLHDMTCPTWVLRHILRAFMQLAIPIALALIFIPASMPIRVLTVITAGGPSVLLMTLNITAMSEHRLIKAGYRPTIAEDIRAKRAITAQSTANHARRERIAQRQMARAARRNR